MKKFCSLLLLVWLFLIGNSQSTTLVISQVYGAGGNTGAVYTNDFVEIFNKGTVPVNLAGYSVQYASAAGNFGTAGLSTNLPSFNLQPGQYFLLQLGSGGTNGIALPAPDFTNTLVGIGATAGKVALVNTTTLLTAVTCPSSATIIDFVGYGTTANCFEGPGPTPAPSAVNAATRRLNGCQDTQDNTADFLAAVVTPRNSSSPFNTCSGCVTPSINASKLRYKSSTPTSMDLLFDRGNGTGAIVLCRQAGPVNATPVSGTAYTANANFGSGSQIGTGNFVVHSTTLSGTVGFTVTGLTAGTKYYFSVFEYNDPGLCYTTSGLVDSFTVGAVVFRPGDMVFIGWDNAAITGGEDRLYLMNMVPVSRGTKFSIVNSRFEAGAPASVRTNRWYGGGSDPYQDPDMHEFEYTGAGILSGSVISMESNGTGGFTNFTINGVSVPSTDFSAKTGTSNFLSTTGTDADQLYIVQGKFKSFGITGTDRYNLLDGLVIHGFTTRTPWVPLTSAVSAANTGGNTRQSRIPQDILCINTEFPNNAFGFAYYNTATGTTGTKNTMLGRLKNIANWVTNAGTNTVDDVITGNPAFNTTTYTINSPKPDGDWNGTVSNDWFDCDNWEGLHVPDSTLAVSIYGLPTAINNCVINTLGSPKAAEYSNISKSGFLQILNAGNLSLVGAGTEKLILEDSFKINAGGVFQFENNANAATDSLQLYSSLSDEEPSNVILGFIAGQGTVELKDARFSGTQNRVNKATASSINFYKLAMNNSRSTQLTGDVTVSNNLNLQNGYITPALPNGKLTLQAGATITSPANIYGFTNRGYQNSFVNGKMYYATNALVNIDFPVGKVAADTLFAPVRLEKATSNTITYDAEYFPSSYSDVSVDIGQLNRVSQMEYWLINADQSISDAKVSLSWRPKSKVGDGNPLNDAAALDALVVSHYFDDDGAGANPSLWHIDGGDLTIMPKNPGATVNYGLVTTNVNVGGFSPFTLGSRSNLNLLPLKLLDFKASVLNNEVLVIWKTSEEVLVKNYEVEHSTDASRFISLNKQPAQNNIHETIYQFTHSNPANGWNYYRLKITDNSGKITYSVVVKVWMGKTDKLIVYPNPAKEFLQVIVPGNSQVLSETGIFSLDGKKQMGFTFRTNTYSINVSKLKPGMYYMRIAENGRVHTERFIKL